MLLVAGLIYSASWTDLKNIVQWLWGRDESQWDEQTKVLSDTIAILEDLPPPEAAGISDAMPYLRRMLAAMHGRRRKDALDCGNGALALLPYG
jgi:hypothetical protein